MLIAQITDLHLGFEPDDPAELNRRRLDAVVAALGAMDPRPDLLLMTGDLADKGDDRVSYARLREAVAPLPFPAWPLPGNHDSRADLTGFFPEVPTADGFFQYEVDAGPLRILMLDTLEEGRHGGAFCEARAAWLAARLVEQSERPTLLAVHHPPVESGLAWMTERPDAPWVRRLESVVAAAPNVVATVAGHYHRPMLAAFAGKPLAVCPATAVQLALDLDPLDPETPDERPMVLEEPPGFALHLWTGRSLVTHFARAEAAPVASRYTPAWQPLLRKLRDEKGPR